MSATIEIKVTGDALKLMERITVPAGALGAAARAMDEENQYTVSHIQAAYLSFPSTGPTVGIGLRVQSNRLRNSLRATKATVSATGVTSSIGSNVKYAAIHEFGGTTRPHVIRAKGGALKFMIGDRVLLRKQINHPGSKMPERGMVRRGIRDRLPEVSAAVSRAIVDFYGGAN